MYGYISWPGVYSFKEEIGMFMEYLREQIDEIMKKMKRQKMQLQNSNCEA